MAIESVGNRANFMAQYLVQTRGRLEDLQLQLATGKSAQTYAGIGADRGFAMGLRSQLSSLEGFGNTITNVDARLNVASAALGRLVKLNADVKSTALKNSVDLDDNGQTTAQRSAMAGLAETLQLLNTRAGDRYLFSGRATDTPSVASIGDILEGNGAKAGLKQLIAERKLADLGTPALGRLAIASPTATSISVSQDIAGLPFGLKLAAASSTLAGAAVTGPSGAPPSLAVDLGAVNPNAGETLQLSFNLPDGTGETITLTATTTNPPPEGSFLIGADTTATAANLQTALTSAIGKLANGALVAASAIAASDDFFGAAPPLRVGGPPFDTATALVPGTPADTVQWYTGETGADSARGTTVARVDQSITVAYGARADEQGIRWLVQNLAVYASVEMPASDPNAQAQAIAMNRRMAQNLSTQAGAQSIQDIQADFAGVQTAMQAAQERHTQSESIVLRMIDRIEGVSPEKVASEILSLQTSLQASYQTTSMLYQLSLVKYL